MVTERVYQTFAEEKTPLIGGGDDRSFPINGLYTILALIFYSAEMPSSGSLNGAKKYIHLLDS